MFEFKIKNKANNGSRARTAEFTLPHGTVQTPMFMPCGTKATVKTLTPEELKEIGAQVVLGNTYHLNLRPTSKLISDMGGLHNFMKWDSPMLTDSGGFQVFSLGKTEDKKPKIQEDGVEFYSYLDGSKHFFSPEKSIQIQKNLGADIIMAFDECAPGTSSHDYAKKAMVRTHNWLIRSLDEYKRICDPEKQTMFPIVQGVIYEDLRKESAEFIAAIDEVKGIAIGGLSVGESKEHMYGMIDIVCPILPSEKPRYLMGVGSPEDIVEGVDRGIDMFDCVLPTRIARHGAFWTPYGRQNLMNAKYARDESPLMDGCDCYACKKFTKAYLHHLMKEGEMLGHRMLSLHNLRFLFRLTEDIREAINNGNFDEFKKEFFSNWK